MVGNFLFNWFSVFPDTPLMAVQLWRLVSYQFLHADFFHIFFNMLMLYFFGPLLERQWGTRGFVKFYLLAGAAGGVVYTILVLAGVLNPLPMVGASGAVYGIMAATAVLYPRATVYMLGFIPMTLRGAVILAVIVSLVQFVSGPNAGGQAAHLAGIAFGLAYIYAKPILTDMRLKSHQGRWHKKIEQRRNFQREVDRILEKINQSGIQSLSSNEKEILREATRREQRQTVNNSQD
jgi:membrane associated rhomboid family serine protease